MIYRQFIEAPKVKTPSGKSLSAPAASEPKTLASKTDYVPSWWKGERAAYQSAQKAMSGINSLPKMKT